MLGYFWGIYGVVIASILSNVYRCIDLAIFIPKEVTFDSPKKTFRRIFILCATILVSYIPGKYVISQDLIDSYLRWVIVAVISLAYSIVVILTVDFLFEKRNFIAMIHRIKGLLGRDKKGIISRKNHHLCVLGAAYVPRCAKKQQ